MQPMFYKIPPSSMASGRLRLAGQTLTPPLPPLLYTSARQPETLTHLIMRGIVMMFHLLGPSH